MKSNHPTLAAPEELYSSNIHMNLKEDLELHGGKQLGHHLDFSHMRLGAEDAANLCLDPRAMEIGR